MLQSRRRRKTLAPFPFRIILLRLQNRYVRSILCRYSQFLSPERFSLKSSMLFILTTVPPLVFVLFCSFFLFWKRTLRCDFFSKLHALLKLKCFRHNFRRQQLTMFCTFVAKSIGAPLSLYWEFYGNCVDCLGSCIWKTWFGSFTCGQTVGRQVWVSPHLDVNYNPTF